MMSKEWKNKLIHFWKAWGVPILVAIVVATSIKSAVADWNDVPTGSMIPTILEGDRIFVNKLSYDLKIPNPYTIIQLVKWSDPKRGDIVVFKSPNDGKRLVKRVIGLPGDSIAMSNNILSINGKPLVYTPLSKNDIDRIGIPEWSRYQFKVEDLTGHEHPVMLKKDHTRFDYFDSFEPIHLPKGKYFMMGDNRDHSADSRFFGPVDRRRIVGRASAIVISRDGSFLHPRWDRFFKELL